VSDARIHHVEYLSLIGHPFIVGYPTVSIGVNLSRQFRAIQAARIAAGCESRDTSFAAEVAPTEAAFMANSQVPWGVNALSGAVTKPAWKGKRSWYLVTTDDKMIPPPAQRQMAKRAGSTVVEVRGSHAVYVSQPQAVIKLIEQAAKGTG
jgi:hypothetical protein